MEMIGTVHVHRDLINQVYAQGQIEAELVKDAPANYYAILRNEQDLNHTVFVCHVGGNVWRKIRSDKELEFFNVRPRDSRQTAFADSLMNPDVLISVALGGAGTGKTTMALAFAASEYMGVDRKSIMLSKPTTMVGEGHAFGPVPGDVSEKYAPYLSSFEIALKRILGSQSTRYMEEMTRRQELQYVPIEMIRGSEFTNCTFIVDEFQNLSWHELKTVASRMGQGTKLILLGDPDQIDTNIPKEETGLWQMLNSPAFKNNKITSSMELTVQYRSPVAALIAEVDKWIKGN